MVFLILYRVSYLEIYNETMFDLLGTLPESWNQLNENQQMTISENEDGIYVKGLSSHLVQNEEEALNLLFEVQSNLYNWPPLFTSHPILSDSFLFSKSTMI